MTMESVIRVPMMTITMTMTIPFLPHSSSGLLFIDVDDDGVNADGHQGGERGEAKQAADQDDVLEEANLGQCLLRGYKKTEMEVGIIIGSSGKPWVL